jgi:hypothetical protein
LKPRVRHPLAEAPEGHVDPHRRLRQVPLQPAGSGDSGGIPRVLDAASGNDSYSLAITRHKLKDAFGAGTVNDLPSASTSLGRAEGRHRPPGVLYLGFKNFHWGRRSRPSFRRRRQSSRENFGIAGIGSVERVSRSWSMNLADGVFGGRLPVIGRSPGRSHSLGMRVGAPLASTTAQVLRRSQRLRPADGLGHDPADGAFLIALCYLKSSSGKAGLL